MSACPNVILAHSLSHLGGGGGCSRMWVQYVPKCLDLGQVDVLSLSTVAFFRHVGDAS